MLSALLAMHELGAIEDNGLVRFGILLPWIAARDGFRLTVKVIHERDQFLQRVQPVELELRHAPHERYGDYWSGELRIAGQSGAGTHWGEPGRYVYRYCLTTPTGQVLDWIVDPYAREFGVGKLAAFTLGYQPHVWSAGEASWRTPALSDLVLYEINLAEFGGSLERLDVLIHYLADLGVNCLELMPLSNVALNVDWGYLPIGYFGVDERFGQRKDLQRLVERAHAAGIAVIFDMVYGHSGVDFAYYDLYTRLGFRENPFMGAFAKDYFGDFGKSTDFHRQLTRDYFHTVNQHWLSVYHADGFRYDCVPNYWDGPEGVGYANLTYQTYRHVRERVQARDPDYLRFDAGPGAPLGLVQCAEQLEGPREVLAQTYSNCTWQNETFDAATAVAHGNFGRLSDLGLKLGLSDYPSFAATPDEQMPKLALQYIENHDHRRFICNFGTYALDETNNPLFRAGDRSRWYKLQPHLIALLCARGIPMLWAGQELCDNHELPEQGLARVAMLRPVDWDHFYDEPGRNTLRLVRALLALRKRHAHLRRGAHFFFNEPDRYQQHGALLYARWDSAAYTLIAVNFSEVPLTVPFWFPVSGNYVEELHGAPHNLNDVVAYEQRIIQLPANYGRIWTMRTG
jgi:maltooligosyltrehalose trehalohydrolase